MAKIPFEFLFGEGQALPFIIQAFTEGLGLEKAIAVIKTGGLSIAEEKIGQVYNYLENVIRPGKEYIKFLQQGNLPNIARIPLALTKTLRNFTYSGVAQGLNTKTGEIQEFNISLSTNTLLTKQQAADQMGDRIAAIPQTYGVETAAVSITGITQNPAGLVLT